MPSGYSSSCKCCAGSPWSRCRALVSPPQGAYQRALSIGTAECVVPPKNLREVGSGGIADFLVAGRNIAVQLLRIGWGCPDGHGPAMLRVNRIWRECDWQWSVAPCQGHKVAKVRSATSRRSSPQPRRVEVLATLWQVWREVAMRRIAGFVASGPLASSAMEAKLCWGSRPFRSQGSGHTLGLGAPIHPASVASTCEGVAYCKQRKFIVCNASRRKPDMFDERLSSHSRSTKAPRA